MFNVNDKGDDVLDTADTEDRDDAGKKAIDDWDNLFEAVEDNGDNSDTNETTPSDGFCFFLDFDPDLPFFFSVTIIFSGVDVIVFIMVYSTSDYWK
jgi:hypothetical protein